MDSSTANAKRTSAEEGLNLPSPETAKTPVPDAPELEKVKGIPEKEFPNVPAWSP